MPQTGLVFKLCRYIFGIIQHVSRSENNKKKCILNARIKTKQKYVDNSMGRGHHKWIIKVLNMNTINFVKVEWGRGGWGEAGVEILIHQMWIFFSHIKNA